MGAQQARFLNRPSRLKSSAGEVNFDHFQVLRVIGKGSFGKVCIVQKKDCGKMYAMKYMNKTQCIEREALRNVVREMEILRHLEHPFLVNLWFSFQDVEDLFMVVDLLLGGDLRYHMQQNVIFTEDSVRLILCEIATALDYLRERSILHRDIKPENIILDEEGHAHLTDFNIATVLNSGQRATSVSGTKPYMAPEVYRCAIDCEASYGLEADWWSLGVCLFELCTGFRPFDIHSITSAEDCLRLFDTKPALPTEISFPLREVVLGLLTVNWKRRLCNLEQVKESRLLEDIDWDAILRKEFKPPFIPQKGHLNCDPSLELEEMIMESRPLHKKKKRLMKQRSNTDFYNTNNASGMSGLSQATTPGNNLLDNFICFNRESWLAEQQRQLKEAQWEKELSESMQASGCHGSSVTVSSKSGKMSSVRHFVSGNEARSHLSRTQSLRVSTTRERSRFSHWLTSSPFCLRRNLADTVPSHAPSPTL